MNLSPHLTLEEMSFSETAVRNGMSNTPGDGVVHELTRLCLEVLEPVRDLLGVQIDITSGYRSTVVNRAVGGSTSSQHCLGQAADFRVRGVSNRQIVDQIARSGVIHFDQLIYEFGETGWVHISRSDSPRWQVLSASIVNGRVSYSPFS